VKAAAFGTWYTGLHADSGLVAGWAHRCQQEAQRLAGEDEHGLVGGWASFAQGMAGFLGPGERRAIMDLADAEAAFERAGKTAMQYLASQYRALAALRFGAIDVADVASRRALVDAERQGHVTALSWARWTRGAVEAAAGDAGPARERIRVALDAQRAIGTYGDTVRLAGVLAWVVAGAGRDELAAYFLGAAEGVRAAAGRHDATAVLSMRDMAGEARALIVGRLDRATYERAFHSGLTLVPDEDMASSHRTTVATGARSAESDAHPRLTQRQWEVARLVAEGLTSPQIGERLVISERTVESHLKHVMKRLNVHTRVEVAAFVHNRHQNPLSADGMPPRSTPP
jgi:non-specific serine/threonine protein kinase